MATVRAHVRLDEPELNNQTRPILRRKMNSWKRRTATLGRVRVPVDTGRLGRSIGEGPTRFTGPRTVTGSTHARTEYAAAVHEGRRARVIRPVRAKALRFQVGGRTVFAQVVRQGPMKGRPFLRNAGMAVAAEMAASD
ncbi:hypothetical protein H7I53_17900 [Mycolicibacterium pulveris]|uniref:Uncharacterized protein n=1 Tax=Mycolicibacterium pulveris TaxID=36813 RepID=A0A7I7UBR5_MYCPV|nr:hypothetical protein [Mycolicibacterium pulveris]MCV6982091.1 hypothetical protein [Mycolicibacterium pulveris]BBY78868.1 hypothetical protein MPUL_00260 [Mycolicibacterium pulveris]